MVTALSLRDLLPAFVVLLLAELTCVASFLLVVAVLHGIDVARRATTSELELPANFVWYAQAVVCVYAPIFADTGEGKPILHLGAADVAVSLAVAAVCAWGGRRAQLKYNARIALQSLATTNHALAGAMLVKGGNNAWPEIKPETLFHYQS